MIVLTGSKGLLGSDFKSFFEDNNISFYAGTRESLDFTKKPELDIFFNKIRPDYIIHCGAYSNVEAAETEKELCFKTNVEGTELVAAKAAEFGIPIMYISTDYVFDGKSGEPYDELSERNPVSYYGKSKAMGEDAVTKLCDKFYIIRTSWLYGENGIDFIDKIIELSRSKSEINVVCDQIGSPTYTKALVPVLYKILISNKFGIYNVTNEGFCSWAEFARTALDELGINLKVNDVKSDEYKSKAKRPLNSRLSKKKIAQCGFGSLPLWKQSLAEHISRCYKRSGEK